MAVLATPAESVLVVTYQIGSNEAGSPITRQKSFPNVRFNAEDQAVYEVAEALFSLVQYPIVSVRRDNRVDLVNE